MKTKKILLNIGRLFIASSLVLLCQITNVGCVVRTIALAKGQKTPIGACNAPYRNTFEEPSI